MQQPLGDLFTAGCIGTVTEADVIAAAGARLPVSPCHDRQRVDPGVPLLGRLVDPGVDASAPARDRRAVRAVVRRDGELSWCCCPDLVEPFSTLAGMDLHLSHVVVDCADPERLVAFWSRLLGVEVQTRWRQYVILSPSGDGAPALTFQRVEEPKIGKNRVHVDLTVADLEAATRHALDLGAEVVEEFTEDGTTARILVDPEGNEFCLVRLAQAAT